MIILTYFSFIYNYYSSSNKTRLILLYFLTRKGLDKEERERIVDRANLKQEEKDAIENISKLGVLLSNEKSKSEMKNVLLWSKTSLSEEPHDNGTFVSFELSRHLPPLKTILQSLLHGSLSASNFPTLVDSQSLLTSWSEFTAASASTLIQDEISRPTEVKATSLRKKKPVWKASPFSKHTVSEDSSLQDGGSLNSRPMIVFLLGGVTYSELNVFHDVIGDVSGSSVSKNGPSSSSLLLGSTHVLTPNEFLEDLSKLSR